MDDDASRADRAGGLVGRRDFSRPCASLLVPLLAAALSLAGCATERALMPTPNVYALGLEEPFDETLPAELRTVDAKVIYATDREPAPREDGRLDYGVERDPALAVGEAAVRIGGDVTWEELAADARSGVRSRTLNLAVVSVAETGRTPDYPLPYDVVGGKRVLAGEPARRMEEAASAARALLLERLALAPRKELLIYVHGVGNTFDDALFTTAELWHYMGRELVPIAYSWPAGQGGVLRGYTYDRESSEFTVFHFKRFLAWLAGLPEVEGIHLVAHSRGTDVVATGIRELVIESWAREELPVERYKLRNVVMAAPDINLEVAFQRTASEGVTHAAERWTFYTSPGDKAIGISEFLFGGRRMGKADFDSVTEEYSARVSFYAERYPGRDAVIQYVGDAGGDHGHNYFRTNPAVASDLVLAVRYGRKAGAEHGRPLDHVRAFFWRIGDDYLERLPAQ